MGAVMEWIATILAILFLIAVRKIPVIRIFAGILVLAVLLSFVFIHELPIPSGRIKQGQQMGSLRCVSIALVEYKGDHEDALPERFSQLFPDYMNSKDVGYFFDKRAKDFNERCKKAAADPTEMDRNSEFDYFAGKIGGLLAASKTPIGVPTCSADGRRMQKLIRVILGNDRIVSTVPEEEYQRRLNGGLPKER